MGRLFVYGTLLPGRLRWTLLAPFVADHHLAVVPGRLFDSGRGWPVAVFAGQPGATIEPGATDELGVPGVAVVLHADRVDEAIALLDRVEGTGVGLLRRVRVTTLAGEEAWAYHPPHTVAGLVTLRSWAEVPLHAER